jgi:hypothetical protein
MNPMVALPVVMFAMNKMQEKRAREEARKQQLHSIRANLAAMHGAPQFGPDTAAAKYSSERGIEADRRRNNQQMMQSAFGAFSDVGNEGPVGSNISGPPAPPEPDRPLTQDELDEILKSREALKGLA